MPLDYTSARHARQARGGTLVVVGQFSNVANWTAFTVESGMLTRRTFLALAALAARNAGAARLPIRKAVLLSMLPRSLSFADRFQLARDVGFEEIECPTTPDPHDAEEIKKASEKAKLRIHSVMNMAHWRLPLSSSDPAAVA